jgi:hypothetical protein
MFGLFGRSQELQRLDRALRSAGLNPRGVAEAVKLTTLSQLKEASLGGAPDLRAYAAAAELIACCVHGSEGFAQANDADQTESVETRLVDALELGYGLDARLVLLPLCQSALNRQPRIGAQKGPRYMSAAAVNRGPRARSGAFAERGVARGGSCGLLTDRPDEARFLKHQLSFPVSTILQ